MIGKLTVGVRWISLPNTVNIYIGRGSKDGSVLACPFVINAHQSREWVIAKYETYLMDALNEGNEPICAEMNRIGSLLLEGNNVNLQCYCKGKGYECRACHGDFIKEIIDDAITHKVIEPMNKKSDYE